MRSAIRASAWDSARTAAVGVSRAPSPASRQQVVDGGDAEWLWDAGWGAVSRLSVSCRDMAGDAVDFGGREVSLKLGKRMTS